MNPRPLVVAFALLLAGCSAGSWFGGSEDPPLPGERIPVMLLEREVTADPGLADLPIRLPPPERNASWPQSGGLSSHAFHHLAANDDLRLAWSADIGAGSAGSGQLLARPVVAEGRVYTMDAEGTVTAFDTRNGNLVWRYEPADLADEVEIGGGLAYDGGWLFATLSSGTVVGLNASTGTEAWHQSLLLPLRAAPTVADGRLLVLTADNQLYALDGATGQPLWRHTGFFEGAGLLGGPSPAVGNSVVVVPYSSAEVYALRLDNGRPLWNDTVQRPRRTQGLAEINDIDGMPVIADSSVYVASYGGQMASIDLLRGIRSWDIDLASTQTPWLAGDFIYLLSTRGEIVCLLRDNGRVRWVAPLPRLKDPDDPGSDPITWSGPILVGDRLLLAGSSGQALSVSPYNGEILGRIDLPAPVLIPPVAADGTVYFLTEDAELLAYR
ncbi:MAG TPA: PQQ-binding-like beta-propeller repeat protein [Geminicoccaceae bacterium]|nr:PQQ-binding-like beta-propeller repeat protein [Geminicoccaceae bacterium]